jgi:hypothetical protein
MGQSVCRALTANFTATRNIQEAFNSKHVPLVTCIYIASPVTVKGLRNWGGVRSSPSTRPVEEGEREKMMNVMKRLVLAVAVVALMMSFAAPAMAQDSCEDCIDVEPSTVPSIDCNLYDYSYIGLSFWYCSDGSYYFV